MANAKPVKKKASMPAATTPRTKKAAVAATLNIVHGAELTTGDAKKGGTSKNAVVTLLNLDQLQIQDGFNPRKVIGDIESLTKSIKTEGLLSALVVRPSDKEGIFWVVAGERRYRALDDLSWDKGIPCLIRTDLADDDDRALAVSVAENSEDGRHNLNYIEIGRVVTRLSASGWTVGRVAKETGLHTQKVRRAMSLMDAPAELQTKVESNEVSMRTALECLKLDDKTRKAVIAELTPMTTEGDIKKIRKELDATATEKVTKTPHRPVTAWRGSREKQKQVQKMCYFLAQAHDDSEQRGTGDYHEIRGSVAYSLWDRGDLSNPILPSIHAEDESNPKKAEKQNEAFMSVVRAEADRYDSANADKG